jgi:hypothetical protein
MIKFYSYLWLRRDTTPYYVGKGSGRRAFIHADHGVHCPADDSRILVFFHETEAEAFESEKNFIRWFGRKDLGTGCLRNLTDGGDAPTNQGPITRQRQSEAAKRRAQTPEGRAHLIAAGRKTDNSQRTAEHCAKLSKVLTGRKASAEQRLHQSLAQKGRPKPPRSEEYRRHISEAQIERWTKKRLAIV